MYTLEQYRKELHNHNSLLQVYNDQSLSESDEDTSYRVWEDINLLASVGGENLVQPPDSLTAFFTWSSAQTVLTFKRFRFFVLTAVTSENVRSTSTLACGKHNSVCMKLQRTLNGGMPVPSVRRLRQCQNSSGSMSSCSNGNEPIPSLRHSSSSHCSCEAGKKFGNLVASGTREGNSECPAFGSITCNNLIAGSPMGKRCFI